VRERERGGRLGDIAAARGSFWPRKKEKKGKRKGKRKKGKDPFFMQYSESRGWLGAGARAEVNLKF
jgi:hypothetical protein